MQGKEKCYLLGIEKKENADNTGIDTERITQGIGDVVDAGERSFVCVMNRAGVYIADSLFELKEKYPDIKVDALIPYEDIAACWDEPLRDRYFGAVEKCEKDAFFTLHYYDGCMEDMISSITDGTHRIVTVLV